MMDTATKRRTLVPGKSATTTASRPVRTRTCILVAGMHRSGTSALTRVVNLHGAALGDRCLADAPDNETGFWENMSVLSVHERLLADLGRSWSDPRPLPEHWRRTPAARRAEQDIADALATEFGAESLFAIKDPRLGPLLKLWLKVLKRMDIRATVCIPFRNPVEVAASLAERDHLPGPLAHLLWRQSVVASARNSRGVPRVAVSYDALLDDWRGSIQRIGVALGIDWPRSDDATAGQVEAFLSDNRRHHGAIANPNEVDGIFRSLQTLEGEGDHDAAWKQLELGVADPAAPVHFEYAELLEYRARSKDAGVARRAEGMHDGPMPPALPIPGAGDAILRSYLVSEQRRDDRVVVYFRASGAAYSEANSVHHDWPASAAMLEFKANLPLVGEGFLRIDPSESHGWFVIRDLRFDGMAAPDLRADSHGSVVVAGGELHLLGSDNDPWVEFPLGGPSPGSGGRTEVSFTVERRSLLTRIEELGTSLASSVAGHARDGAVNAAAAAAQIGHLVRSDVALVHALAVGLAKRVGEICALVESQQSVLASVKERGAEQLQSLLASSQEAEARLDARLGEVQSDADAVAGRLEARMDGLGASFESLRAILLAAADAAVDLAESFARVGTAIAASDAQAASLRASLDRESVRMREALDTGSRAIRQALEDQSAQMHEALAVGLAGLRDIVQAEAAGTRARVDAEAARMLDAAQADAAQARASLAVEVVQVRETLGTETALVREMLEAEIARVRDAIDQHRSVVRADIGAVAADTRELDRKQVEASDLLLEIREQLLRVEERRVLSRMRKLLGVVGQ